MNYDRHCFAGLDTLAPTFREAKLASLRIRPSELNLEALGKSLDGAATECPPSTTLQTGETVVWQGEFIRGAQTLQTHHWKILMAYALLNSLKEPENHSWLKLAKELGANALLAQGVVQGVVTVPNGGFNV